MGENVDIPKEYTDHKVFTDLELIKDTYDCLFESSFCFLPNGLPGQSFNYKAYFFRSLGNTIEGISLLLSRVHVNDAYALLRKYFDEVMIYIYFSALTEDEIHEHPDDLFLSVQTIKDWTEGKIRTPGIKKIISYLNNSWSYRDLMNKYVFEQGKGFDKIRSYLDDQMHINGFGILANNDDAIYNKRQVLQLNDFQKCLSPIFALHFASIIYLDGHFLMSSDYVDYLDMGQEPPEDSQYWIVPIYCMR